SIDLINDVRHGWEVGNALGTFHTLLSDLPPERLADTLPGFHITPGYLEHYDRVLQDHPKAGTDREEWCFRFVERGRSWAWVLEKALSEGRLCLRPIHGDPKVNNILMDDVTGRALGMIDLDTVKPGLIQYDIGDCLRSSCNRLGEETDDWEQVKFDTDLGKVVLEGYCAIARQFLTPADFELLPDACRLIAFELGLRFFTDHLEGNVYFKASHPGHNLSRALVQFKLAASLDEQMGELRSVIEAIR
ncbi:MAG: phosphotransferase enzyme family protein, partial [Terrimicrobiaceae bacterium]